MRANDGRLLEVRGVVKRFPGVVALRGVHLEVGPGEVHALVGENGAGKSTLIKVLSGVYPQDEGEVFIHGVSTGIKSTKHAQELGITTIHQELLLAPHLTGLQNMFLGHELRKPGFARFLGRLDDKAMALQAGPLCEEFGLDMRVLLRPVEELSALEKRVVMLLKALIFKAELIIMDEITAGLADREREALFEHIKALKAQGISIVWVTHRLEELIGRADRATVLRDGRYVGTVDVDPSGANLDAIVKMMIGREIASHEELLANEVQEREVNESAEVVLNVEGLTRGRKLQDISLQIRGGEVLGVAGMAGSGRTELVRAIMGADRRDAGRIQLNGETLKLHSPREAYRAGMSLVPEDRKSQGILGDLSVTENISVAALWRLLVGGWFIRKRREASVAVNYQKELDIRTSTMKRPILFLSGGNQQKTILARSLFAESKVMLLDEPTQGIDVAAKLEVYRLINRFVQGGGSALVASSELPELVAMSDRVIVLREGRMVAELKGEVHGSQAEKLALEETIVALATGARNGSEHGHG